MSKDFFRAYIECALWSDLDDNYSEDDIAPETLRKMREECATFEAAHAPLLSRAYAEREWYTAAHAGHDFWLTRNGHGSGFWDRGLGDVGAALTREAKAYGTVDLIVCDDGLIRA